jgi:hypothetical protein
LQFAHNETPQAKFAKLQQALGAYRFPQADTLPLLATLLSLPQPEGIPPLTLSPQKQKQKTQEALVAWIMEEAEKAAVYCAWEDLHWIDPSTLEVLTLFLEQIPTTRMFAMLTFRPDFTPPWSPRSYLTQLTLSRLGRPHVEVMVAKVTGGKALPSEVLRQIVAKTDGVPLFVEELTKMVVESGLLIEADNHYELRGPLPPLAIPSTLQDSLMARLDRLAPVREIAQVGAVLGREFSYELIHAVSPLAEATLQSGLRQLVEAELIYQRGLPPQATYLFKHALIQDTAYQSLLKSRRQQLHQQTAQVLADRFPETVETQPELLAHHCTEAGLKEQAIPYWQQAGQRASQRSANAEAIIHLTKGLELLKTLPETSERAQQELMLQVTLGSSLIVTRGFAAPDVEKTYLRAQYLCRQVGETPQLFSMLRGLIVFYLVRGDVQTAYKLKKQFLNLAQHVQDPAHLAEAHYTMGGAMFTFGEFTVAREHFEQGIAFYDPQKHRALALVYGHDPRMACLSFAAHTLWLLGYPEQALKKMYQSLSWAQELSYPYNLAGALGHAAQLHQYRREGQATYERAAASFTLATEQGFALLIAMGNIWKGAALAAQGEGAAAILLICHGLDACSAIESVIWRSHHLALLAEVYGKVEQPEAGLSVLAEALEVVGRTGDRSYEAELYRLKGTLTLQEASQKSKGKSQKSKVETRPQPLTPSTQAEAEAEECFLKAIEIARRQQAKSLELRSTTSLARLWQQQDKHHEAHQMLAEIYNWFTEGFDTKDLQEAKALLQELA